MSETTSSKSFDINIPLHLTQEEIKYCLAALDKLVKDGGLRLGDVIPISGAAKKLQEKLPPPETAKVESNPEGFKVPVPVMKEPNSH